MTRILAAAAALCFCVFLSGMASAADIVCPRYAAGAEVKPAADLYSKNGVLHVALNYWTAVDEAGRTLFCFQTPDGRESPTFHLQPGDTLNIDLTDMVPPVGGRSEIAVAAANACGSNTMTPSSTNMHFHGLNTSPKCHSDEIIHTLVNSGQTFTYTIKVPSNEPPGLYWYHPHVHGIASAAVQGGATGAIVVEGIENIQPAVAGLSQRVLVIRDQPLLNGAGKKNAPFWDVSVNYVPVPYPSYPPAVVKMTSGTREFWRVVNAAANTILDLQVTFDGKAQTMQVAALDGVPTGSQDGKQQGTLLPEKHILLGPGARAEFIVSAPPGNVSRAVLSTRTIDGGPGGDSNPARPLVLIKTKSGPTGLSRVPERAAPPHKQRFVDVDDAKVTANRKLYFWEVAFPRGKRVQKPDDPLSFFIVVDGQDAHVYDPNDPPDIITNKGVVEDWVIENRTNEVHEFHIHQIHFKLLEVNGVPVRKQQRQWYDTYQVGYWDGVSKTYPSIKVRMDFRGAVAGDFVYHCHILDHEDGGMMAIIRVLPKA